MSGNQDDTPRRRTVRSYVLREGRMTAAQERALRELWPRFGIDAADAPLDLDAQFGRVAPRVLEIGFGRGDTLLTMAAAEPGTDFLGVDVHRPGIGHLLNGIVERALTNVRVCRADAAELIREAIADETFERILVLFPDPWPKKRHHKRRLLTRPFVKLIAGKLVAGGELLIVTDSASYGEQIEEALAGVDTLRRVAWELSIAGTTRYGRRAERHGNPILEFALRKV